MIVAALSRKYVYVMQRPEEGNADGDRGDVGPKRIIQETVPVRPAAVIVVTAMITAPSVMIVTVGATGMAISMTSSYSTRTNAVTTAYSTWANAVTTAYSTRTSAMTELRSPERATAAGSPNIARLTGST